MTGAGMAASDVLVCVTIDTEPDSPDWAPAGSGLGNLDRLPRVHDRLREWGARPTYLVTHSVAADPRGLRALEAVMAGGGAEIGAHLHPLETPPFGEAGDSSWCCRLPRPLLAAKLERLTTVLADHFGQPASFRAGRFGIGPETVRAVGGAGYVVDSSMTPFVSWELVGGPAFVDAPTDPHRLCVAAPGGPGDRPLLEIPLSIRPNRGSGRGFWRLWLRIFGPEARSRRGPLAALYRAVRVVRPVWLRPTYCDGEQMIALAERIRRERRSGPTILTVMFHSNECCPGTSPYCASEDDVETLLGRLGVFLDHARRCGWSCATLGEAGSRWAAARPAG